MEKKIGVLQGALSTLKAMADIKLGKEIEERKSAITDKVGEITIDTCIGFDTGIWETGINKDGQWYIVEQYGEEEYGDEKEEVARVGHAKWVNAIKSNPDMELPNINVWE